MKYYFHFLLTGKIIELEVLPIHARDLGVNETVMLNTYFSDIFRSKTFSTITEIINEKGKRIYKLKISYLPKFNTDTKEDD